MHRQEMSYDASVMHDQSALRLGLSEEQQAFENFESLCVEYKILTRLLIKYFQEYKKTLNTDDVHHLSASSFG